MNVKEFFNRKLIISDTSSNDKFISETIDLIKDNWNITTNKNELLIKVSKEPFVAEDNTLVQNFILIISPTQKLLRKFEKEYPEMII